jgi:hypothetical protein
MAASRFPDIVTSPPKRRRASLPTPMCRAATEKCKSFLVLFFKKELLGLK